MRNHMAIAAIGLCMTAIPGCGDDDPEPTPQTQAPDAAPAIVGYAELAYRNYSDAVSGAEALKAALETFVAAPTEANLQSAKDAWNAARPTYLQTEVFRFYGGPIDDEATGPEGQINGWPLDEAYIDYVDDGQGGVLEGGIVNTPAEYPTIDSDLVAELNEQGGEANLSAGWHAIEFLLWGQDLSETGPGARPATDFDDATATVPNPDRRRDYLIAAVDLLIADLTTVRDAWAPDADNYRASFVAAEQAEVLTRILTGMGTLSGGELAGERMNNAFETKDQEEEHSCFSDTTHVDHLNDVVGIENVYLGRYGGQDGPGLDEVVAAIDADLDARMKSKLSAAIAAIEAIPKPFDQAILDESAGGGREQVQAAIDALYELTDTIVEVATALGITVNTEV